MRFTWLAKPSRFHMVCETMKRFTWFVKPCEIQTIKPVNFHGVLTKPCEITDPYGSLRSDVVTTGQRTHTHAHGNACVVWVEGRGSKIPHGQKF